MSYTRSDWIKLKDTDDPYKHWGSTGPIEARFFEPGERVSHEIQLGPVNATQPDGKTRFAFDDMDRPVAVPKAAAHPNAPQGGPPWSDGDDGLPDIALDTVIVGVIDTDIPLGHARARFADGQSRILAAWQMMAQHPERRPAGHAGRANMPFGRELLQSEIETELRAASGGSLTGALDQTAFNIATDSLDMDEPILSRALLGRASHGAHVLDVCAGADPQANGDDEAAFRDRTRIIAVNAPNARIFGPSGAYLDDYMLHGIQYIVDRSDDMWSKSAAKNQLDALNGKDKGFPIVINMSFGKQAGSKDKIDEFARALDALNAWRKANDWKEVRFVMPSGNDNLDQCNAFLSLTANKAETLNWRIQPGDHSSNHAEVWIPLGDNSGSHEFIFGIAAPGGPSLAAPLPSGSVGELHYFTVSHKGSVVGHVYHRLHKYDSIHKRQLVLCLAPTYRPLSVDQVTDPGLWVLSLQVDQAYDFVVNASVQTDQSLSLGTGVTRRSYFDDPDYQSHDAMGDAMLSHSFDPANPVAAQSSEAASSSPVKRRGTMNASASHEYVACVGGYRRSDGRPVGYSSTARGTDGTAMNIPGANFGHAAGHRDTPTAAFATDDNPALFGILAAGSSDGSVVAMRGTSFACSQGTRLIARELMSPTRDSAQEILQICAAESEARGEYYGVERPVELIDGVGRGRILDHYRNWISQR